MSKQRFNIDQAITPKVGATFTLRRSPVPTQGNIYHVKEYITPENCDRVFSNGVILHEMPPDAVYDERKFDPVDLTTEQVNALIEETLPQEV